MPWLEGVDNMQILAAISMGFMVGGVLGGIYIGWFVSVLLCFISGLFACLAAILYKGQELMKDIVGIMDTEVISDGKSKRKQDDAVGRDN